MAGEEPRGLPTMLPKVSPKVSPRCPQGCSNLPRLVTDPQQGESCSARLPKPTAAKPVQVWKPGHGTPQLLSAVEKDYNYSIFSTIFPEKSVICCPSVCFLLLVSRFVSFFSCLLGEEAAGAALG